MRTLRCIELSHLRSQSYRGWIQDREPHSLGLLLAALSVLPPAPPAPLADRGLRRGWMPSETLHLWAGRAVQVMLAREGPQGPAASLLQMVTESLPHTVTGEEQNPAFFLRAAAHQSRKE